MSDKSPTTSRRLQGELNRLVVWLAVSSVAFVATLAFVPFKALRSDWREAHQSYNLQAQAVNIQPIEPSIKQIWRPEISLTDRCTSCHLGMGAAPSVEGGDTLAKAHTDVYHDVGRMGCTICHRGQGRATSTEEAHGYVKHWEDPMLPVDYLEASCGPCHAESMSVSPRAVSRTGAELFTGNGCDRCHTVDAPPGERQTSFERIGLTDYQRDWQGLHAAPKLAEAGYPPGASVAPLPGDDVALLNDYLDSLVGAPKLMLGLQVGRELGCNGCHHLWGFGSDQGPSIADAAAKPATMRDFTSVPGPHTSVGWHREHLRNASVVSPGSKMPNFNLDLDNEEALLTLIMALRHYDLSLDELPPGTVLARVSRTRPAVEDGEALFRQFCVGCHADGVDDRIVPPNKSVPHITYPSVLSVATADYLEYSISNGREGREMPAWEQPEFGLQPREIEAIARFLVGHLPEPPPLAAVRAAMSAADTTMGRQLFNADCARCHGRDAAGTLLAPKLANPELLGLASDRALFETVTRGRPATGMPKMPDYSARFLANVITWLRTTVPRSVTDGIRGRATRLLGVAEIDAYESVGVPESGSGIYEARCASCHEGLREPGIGPRLDTPEFLEIASDGFIVAAALIDEGHCKATDESTGPKLSRGDVDHVVAYLRASAPLEPLRPAKASLSGRADSGRSLFETHCSGCHGIDGGGDKAPALNNQALLASATDGFLMATIIRGRTGTAMPSWGPGGAAQPPLSPRDVLDLVAFVRSWQTPRGESPEEVVAQARSRDSNEN